MQLFSNYLTDCKYNTIDLDIPLKKITYICRFAY